MNVASIELLACDAGWRNYYFVKQTTDAGIVGYSEFSEGFGSPGVSRVIQELSQQVIGQPVFSHEQIYQKLTASCRPALSGVVGQALGAIENALLDAKAKTLGVPVYELLGGKLRDDIRVYWSHCATWRILYPQYYQPAITSLDGVRDIGCEVWDKGFSALKTNIFDFDADPARTWMPGFGKPFAPGRNVDRNILRNIRACLEALRDGAGPDIDILIDLNFNANTEGLLNILKYIDDLDIFWVEIDTYNAQAMRYIREQSRHTISGLETLIGIREFLPYFAEQAMDVPIINAVWNGVWQSMRIAALAEAHEMSCAPHNYYGHLSTMMNVHFAAAIPNLRTMEIDIDRLAWDDELFTYSPEITAGLLKIPDTPGWGTEPDEAALKAHPVR